MNLSADGGESAAETGAPIGNLPNAVVIATASEPIGWLRRALKLLGPGLVTGAADDDPSGISTYSSVGAQFGVSMLWTMPLI